MQELNIVHAMGDEILFVDNLRDAKDLPYVRKSYNSIVHCRGGRIVVEMGESSSEGRPRATAVDARWQADGANAR